MPADSSLIRAYFLSVIASIMLLCDNLKVNKANRPVLQEVQFKDRSFMRRHWRCQKPQANLKEKATNSLAHRICWPWWKWRSIVGWCHSDRVYCNIRFRHNGTVGKFDNSTDANKEGLSDHYRKRWLLGQHQARDAPHTRKTDHFDECIAHHWSDFGPMYCRLGLWTSTSSCQTG